MSDRFVSRDLFMLKCCLDRHMTPKMYNKAANDFHLSLRFVPSRFVANNLIKIFHDALFANDDILFFDKDFHNVVFCTNEMCILDADLGKIPLDDVNLDEDDPECIVLVRILAKHNKF